MKETYKNHIIAFLLVVVIVMAVVFWVPRWASPAPSGQSSSQNMPLMAGMPMATKSFEVTNGQPVPTISFTIKQDSTGGWDIHAATTNFTFTPEKIDGEPVLGEGHIHLYVDGNLIVVLGPWCHLDLLPPGRHTIREALANNDHSLYEFKGNDIDATQNITVK